MTLQLIKNNADTKQVLNYQTISVGYSFLCHPQLHSQSHIHFFIFIITDILYKAINIYIHAKTTHISSSLGTVVGSSTRTRRLSILTGALERAVA